MTQAGANKDYSGRTKSQWRGWVWNRIRERVQPEKDTTILYLLGPTPKANDVREALKRGYQEHNLIGVDQDRGNVLKAREQGLLALHGDIDRIAVNWPDDWPVQASIGDFCGGLSRGVAAYFYALQMGEAFADSVLVTNMLKGRDAYTNQIRDMISGMRGRIKAMVEAMGKQSGRPPRDPSRKRPKRRRNNHLIAAVVKNIWPEVLDSDRLLAQIAFIGFTCGSFYDAGGLDATTYQSGHLVYETAMIHYKRIPLDHPFYLERPTAAVFEYGDSQGSDHCFDMERNLRTCYLLCKTNDIEDRTEEFNRHLPDGERPKQCFSYRKEVLEEIQRKEEAIGKRIRRQMAAVRAHQTRRK